MSNGKMAGKRVLVTGAGIGIGRGVALEFAREGAAVALHYSSSGTEAEEVAGEIRKTGGKAQVFKADFKQVEGLRELAEKATEFLGGIDILINNSGMTLTLPFEQVTQKNFDDIYGINIRAQFFLTQALVPKLAAQPGSSIVNISSIHAYAAMIDHSVYAGTKGAIVAYTRELALELAPQRIRVNGIAPGYILIEKVKRAMGEGFDFGKVGKIIPVGRVGTPWDVARVAMFLASEDAGFITGQTLQLDGGQSVIMPLASEFTAAHADRAK